MKYIDDVAAAGENGLRELRVASKDFNEVSLINGQTVLEVLSKMSESITLPTAEELFHRVEVRQKIIGAVLLARAGRITEPEIFLSLATASDESGMHDLALAGFACLDADTVDSFLIDILKNRPVDHRRCSMACGFLGSRNTVEAVPEIVKCMKDSQFTAILNAFLALRSLQYEEAIPLALDCLARGIPEPEDESAVLVRSLEIVTGQRFGNDVTTWRTWWESASRPEK
ncbi:MAG: hypothetical protein H7Z41_05825 [Cytophagales bacterium]|nr:hypothetical protein [Armatimonadota bacterium]